MSKLRFVVIGDVHHVRPEGHVMALSGRARGVTEEADVTRRTILGRVDDEPILLDDVRARVPAQDDDRFVYGWGFLEDSMPGWWEVAIDGDAVAVDWHVYGRGIAGSLRWQGRGQKTTFVRRPQIPSSCGPLPPLDSIAGVQLRAASLGGRNGPYAITQNGRANA